MNIVEKQIDHIKSQTNKGTIMIMQNKQEILSILQKVRLLEVADSSERKGSQIKNQLLFSF